jgi:hypothetical protein
MIYIIEQSKVKIDCKIKIIIFVSCDSMNMKEN